MDESATGFLVLIGISVVAALLAHWVIRRYLLASLCAAVGASIAFQFVVYLHLGYLDPFFIFALVVGAAVAFGVAVVIGVPFIRARRKRDDDHVA
jgi:hypothetical protein